MANEQAGKWPGNLPETCDQCDEPLKGIFIDGRLWTGSWGIPCEYCHESHGVGLGLGKGQKYSLSTRSKLAG